MPLKFSFILCSILRNIKHDGMNLVSQYALNVDIAMKMHPIVIAVNDKQEPLGNQIIVTCMSNYV